MYMLTFAIKNWFKTNSFQVRFICMVSVHYPYAFPPLPPPPLIQYLTLGLIKQSWFNSKQDQIRARYLKGNCIR
jgi:hypothetical protein